ncbi:hypothetical protein AYO44_09980 [Planctomycetaceae bacterium SCGC AG-212-F19]|nr:hypothetical protein AYO44_09980 [Planctomycetaceae bacterium SCGC AG-212-F19]
MLKVIKLAFEVRYDEGYRYLDHCGETLVRIRRHSKSWVVNSVNPQLGALNNYVEKLTLTIGNEGFTLQTDEEFDTSKAEKKSEAFGLEAEKLAGIILDTIGVPDTRRVGFRCMFLAPADSLEDANRFMCNVSGSPLLDHLTGSTNSELRIADLTYVTEEPESGIRRRIQLMSVTRLQAGTPLPTGLSSDEGSGGVVADVDTFTRPESGHFTRTNMFIQGSYLKAKKIARQLFEWMRENQQRRG